MLWDTWTETRDSEARKQCFIVTAQTQQTHVQKLSPENKGDTLYIPLQAGYRGKEKKKKQHNVQSIYGYMQFYRLLHPCAKCPCTPTAAWPSSRLDSLGLSLCYAIPSSLLLTQNTGLSISLLVLLPATLPLLAFFPLLHSLCPLLLAVPFCI
jgi:hypothetical protein